MANVWDFDAIFMVLVTFSKYIFSSNLIFVQLVSLGNEFGVDTLTGAGNNGQGVLFKSDGTEDEIGISAKPFKKINSKFLILR